MPGAVYGAMAASAAAALDSAAASSTAARTVVVEHLQLHSPLVFAEPDDDEPQPRGRTIQFVVDPSEGAQSQPFEIFSRARDAEQGWTRHAEGRLSSGAGLHAVPEPVDVQALRARLEPADLAAVYRAKAAVGIDFGPAFHSLEAVWAGEGEAVAVVALPDSADGGGLDVHPILLDGCFQALSAARDSQGTATPDTTYMPFGWERLRLTGSLPERLVCHARMRDSSTGRHPAADAEGPAEVLTGDLWLYSTDGAPLGELAGFTVKRATRAALLSAVEGLGDLLYEVVWRDRPLADPMPAADFLLEAAEVAERTGTLSEHLEREGVAFADRAGLLADLERLSHAYALAALDRLGWRRRAGDHVDVEDLRQRLGVADQHRRLFGRLLEMLAEAGVLAPADGDGWTVAAGADDARPDESLADPAGLAAELAARHPHGSHELGAPAALRRRAGASADRRRRPCGPAVRRRAQRGGLVPEGARVPGCEPAAGRRRLGGGVGTARGTAAPGAGSGRGHGLGDRGDTPGASGPTVRLHLHRHIRRFLHRGRGASGRPRRAHRVPGARHRVGPGGSGLRRPRLRPGGRGQRASRHQGPGPVAGPLPPAAGPVRPARGPGGGAGPRLPGPHVRAAGRLVALRRLLPAEPRPGRARTCGAERWATPASRLSKSSARTSSTTAGLSARASYWPRGPEAVTTRAGVWLLAADRGGTAARLAAALAQRNQAVVLAGEVSDPEAAETDSAPPGVERALIDIGSRQAWKAVVKALPADMPLRGVAHLSALDGHGPTATTAEMAEDVRRATASALALLQGLTDADATPAEGVLLVTTGAQVLEGERSGQLAGATLWGFGKALAREAQHLRTRMIDLDPAEHPPASGLVEELLGGDAETHVAYRDGGRRAARLVRSGAVNARLALPEEPGWRLAPDPGGALEELRTEPVPPRRLEAGEVRVAVEAAGLNFRDVLMGMGMLEEGSLLGREMCGRIVEAAPDVGGVAAGDRVVGLGFGTFGPEVVTKAELVAPVPPDTPSSGTGLHTAGLHHGCAGVRGRPGSPPASVC